MKFSIYLDTGAVIEFDAPDLIRTVNKLTGKLQSLEWTDAIGNVPRYIDVDHIVAVTRDVEVSDD
jgi:hypothetical protein